MWGFESEGTTSSSLSLTEGVSLSSHQDIFLSLCQGQRLECVWVWGVTENQVTAAAAAAKTTDAAVTVTITAADAVTDAATLTITAAVVAGVTTAALLLLLLLLC